MALYCYIKRTASFSPETVAKKARNKKRKLALGVFIVGLFFLGNVIYPIVSYQLIIAPKFADMFISPTSESQAQLSFGSPASVLGQEIDLMDFTQAKNWFPDNDAKFDHEKEDYYHLSIPKLTIEKALVAVNGEDLKKTLIQYPGSALPGRYGNTVIFGHSVLPQFFNPKNYLTIFSTLPTLKPSDEIVITYDGVKYKYLIEKMIEVLPTDISILAQRYDDSYLTLITCVPPGTYLKRLIIRARLAKL